MNFNAPTALTTAFLVLDQIKLNVSLAQQAITFMKASAFKHAKMAFTPMESSTYVSNAILDALPV